MNSTTPKTFDCVDSMREAREKLAAELGEKSYEDMVHSLRAHEYADPLLKQLAESLAQHVEQTGDSR